MVVSFRKWPDLVNKIRVNKGRVLDFMIVFDVGLNKLLMMWGGTYYEYLYIFFTCYLKYRYTTMQMFYKDPIIKRAKSVASPVNWRGSSFRFKQYEWNETYVCTYLKHMHFQSKYTAVSKKIQTTLT